MNMKKIHQIFCSLAVCTIMLGGNTTPACAGDVNSIRLDEHRVRYHIPLPEQPWGSCDKVVITKDTTVTFTTSRPIKMVYTLDGTTPTPSSTIYTSPIKVSDNTIIKIATVLPSGKMSRIRTVNVEKQTYAPAIKIDGVNLDCR